MELFAEIKAAQLKARKDRRGPEAAALTTFIGEVENASKIEGKPVTDEKTIATLKKYLKNSEETNRIAGDYRDSDAADRAWMEIELWNSFLPKQLTEDQLRAEIATIVTPIPGQVTAKPNIGAVMGALKTKFPGRYDGGMAQKLIKEALA